MSLNKVMLIGNVGMDPEVRYMNDNQTKVARVRLATTERYSDRTSGEPREVTEWHTVTVWRRQADVIEKYVRKGSQIFVEGKLQTREWTDQSGNKRYSTEIVADNIQLLGKRPDGVPAPAAPQPKPVSTPAGPGGYQAPYQPNTGNTADSSASAASAAASAANNFAIDGNNDDDLPF